MLFTTTYIILDINKKGEDEDYPLIQAIINNNIEIARLLIEYANYNNINLVINEKDNEGDYPLLIAIEKNNMEMLESIIQYAKIKNTILICGDKNKDGDYPLLRAIANNNFEMVKLIITYAINHQIVLEINEQDIINDLRDNFSDSISINNIIDVNIINLLSIYRNNNEINIITI